MTSLSTALSFGQMILVRYIQSTLFVTGIVGSTSNIILFSQRKFRKNSCCACLYIQILKKLDLLFDSYLLTDFLASSIWSIVLLLMSIIPALYALDHSPNPIFDGRFCKARGYISQSSAMLSRWLLVMACIDRCLLTSTNAHLRHFSTVLIARKMIIFLSILWILIPVHMLIFTDVRTVGYITCILSTTGSAFYHTIYTVICGGILPPLIMLICAKLIWKSLQSKRQRQAILNVNSQQKRQERRDIQVLLMLLFQVVVFVLFTFPYMTFNLYLASTRSVTNKSIDRLAIESFLQTFTEMTVFIYPSVSFYSNTLVSQTFRNELKILFYQLFTCGQRPHFHNQNRVGPSTKTKIMTRRNDLPMSLITINN